MAKYLAKARTFSKEIKGVLRIAAAGLSYGLFDKAFTMSDHGEYLAALLMVAAAVVFGFIAVWGWSGFSEHPKATKPLKWGLRLTVLGWGIVSAFVIWKSKGTKPVTNVTSADLTNVHTYVSYFGNIVPSRTWGTLAIGLSLGILVASLWRRQYRQTCPDERLHTLATTDAESIERRVRIPWILYRPYLDGSEPYIDFHFSIFNNSLFDLVIDNLIKGDIWSESFDKPLHYEPKVFPAHPILCRSRSGTNFIITHALRVEEVSRFEGKEILIWFDGLGITFAGTEQFPNIGATTLNTKGFCLKTKEGAWRNPNDADEFAFLYSEEQWAALQSGTTGAHSIELEELRAKVKGIDAPSLAAPEIVAFDPILEMVSKETEIGSYVKLGTDLFGHHEDIKSAAFLPIFLKPIKGTVQSVDIKADITLKGENYNDRVAAARWYGRDSAVIPLRGNETRELYIALYDRRLTTYENQDRNRPIERLIRASTVYAKIHAYAQYGNDEFLNLEWWVRIFLNDEHWSVEFIDKGVFDQPPV